MDGKTSVVGDIIDYFDQEASDFRSRAACSNLATHTGLNCFALRTL